MVEIMVGSSLYPYHSLTAEGSVYSIKMKKFVSLCKDKDGYAICTVTLPDGRRLTKRVHRMIAEQFISNPNSKPIVNHKDGNKFNNNVNNLEWVTAKENRQHAVSIGLLKDKAEDNANSKLKNSDVFRIRELYKTGLIKQEELAIIFNISQAEIGNIVRRDNWRSI